jgi:hypothetical protein
MKLSTRNLVTLAVFAALWGLSEIGLGSVLKAFDLPFSGAFLAAIGMVIALTARSFVPGRGTTLFVGVTVMILKLFSIGSILIGPMIGILMEAVLAEVVLSLFKRPSLPAFLLAASSALLWVLVQPFITGVLLFGRDLFTIWLDLLDLGERFLGLDPAAAGWIVLVLVFIHVLIGTTAGWFAWSAGKILQKRMPGTTRTT